MTSLRLLTLQFWILSGLWIPSLAQSTTISLASTKATTITQTGELSSLPLNQQNVTQSLYQTTANPTNQLNKNSSIGPESGSTKNADTTTDSDVSAFPETDVPLSTASQKNSVYNITTPYSVSNITGDETIIVTQSPVNTSRVTGQTPTETQINTNITMSNINSTEDDTTTPPFHHSPANATEASVFNSSTASMSNTSAILHSTVNATTPLTTNVTEPDFSNTTDMGLGNLTSTDSGLGNLTSTDSGLGNLTTSDSGLGNLTTGVPGLGNLTSTETDNTTLTQVSDNSTTTDRSRTSVGTTMKPWQPQEPSGKGSFGPSTSNLTVIVVPILAILILCAIAICVFVMCKRARKAARRTRTPEELWSKDKNSSENQNSTGSPFITAPYHSGQEPSASGHDNIAYSKDEEKTKSPYGNGTISKERNDTHKHGSLQEQRTDTTKNGHTYSTGYDKLENNDDKPIQNAQTNKPWYKKLNTADDTNIELASIVIESDPDDSNRYFRKSDMGDWYRIVMKKKRPKDTEKLINKMDIKGKSGKHGRDQSHHHSDKDQKSRHRPSFHQDGKESRDKHLYSKDRSHSPDKTRHRGSEQELSSTLPKARDAKTVDNERLTASLPMNASVTKNQPVKQSVNTSPVKQSATPSAKVIMSNPISPSKSKSASIENSKTMGAKGKSTLNEADFSQAPAPRPRIIMSQPKTSNNAPKVFQSDNRTLDAVRRTSMQESSVDTKDDKSVARSQSQKRPESVPRLNLPR